MIDRMWTRDQCGNVSRKGRDQCEDSEQHIVEVIVAKKTSKGRIRGATSAERGGTNM